MSARTGGLAIARIARRAATALVLAVIGVTAGGSHAPLGAQQLVQAVILSPDPGEQIPQNSVAVAVSFIDPDQRLDPSTIRLVVGGRDVTSEATVSAELVTWRPLQPVVQGSQRASLTAQDRDGVQISPVAWSFFVLPPVAGRAPQAGEELASRGVPSWARLQGSVIFENTTASVSGAGSEFRRDEDFLPRLWVNANGYITSGIRYGARIHLSGYESSTAQPVNRYRLNVKSERLNLTIGDTNPYLGDLILQGRRVRGVHGSAQLGFFGLQIVTGQDRRAVEGALDPSDSTVVSRSGTFARDIIAIRPTFGRGNRFQFGVTAMRARDDVNSIPELRTNDPSDPDAPTESASPLPKDNLVMGMDLTTRWFANRLTLQFQSAASLLANDISGGPLTEADLQDLADDLDIEIPEVIKDPAKYEKYFIINASLTPLDISGLTNLAHQARGTLQLGDHFVSAEFRSIGSSYYTLGNPSLQRDRQGFRVQDAFSLLNRSLTTTVGYEQDRDNVDGVKTATTTTSDLFADVTWQAAPDRPGVNAAIRLGSRSSDAASGADGALDEATRTLGLGAVYPLNVLEGYRTRVNANWSLLTREDTENPQLGSRNSYYLVGFNGESLDRRQQFGVAYGLNPSATDVGDEELNVTFHRLAANGRRLVAPRWYALADATLTFARTADDDLSNVDLDGLGLAYNRIELMGGAEWEWTTSSFVTIEAGIVSFSDDQNPTTDTRELLTRIRVNRPF